MRKLEAALSGESRQKSEIRHLLSERVALEAQVRLGKPQIFLSF